MLNRKTATLLALILGSLAGALAAPIGRDGYLSREFPPPRLAVVPPFDRPRVESLDEPWEFTQVLYDTDSTQSGWRDSLNAVPVAMEFTHSGRGYIAALHTVFRTTDYGRSWRNLDATPPPPRNRPSAFGVLRDPSFISDLSARKVVRTNPEADTLLVSAFNVREQTGSVWVMYYLNGMRLHRTSDSTEGAVFRTDHWLHSVAIPDSIMVYAFAGLDGGLYQNDTLPYNGSWDELNPDKVLIHSGRNDSLHLVDTWVGGSDAVQDFVMATGSHQWVSRDRGRWWRIQPAADSVFDNCVSFCDSLHGMVGGGIVSPQSAGWVHATSDGGHTWTGRTLNSQLPIRAVDMITPNLGFAGGGDYHVPAGELWRTNDGGQTWQRELQVSAEISAISHARISNACVDVIAAGYFPDFSGGVWRTRVYSPDSSAALLVTQPDTLEFGLQVEHVADTLVTIIRNIGAVADTITGFISAPPFRTQWSVSEPIPLPPGDERELPIIFRSDTAGTFNKRIQIQNANTGLVEIVCRSQVGVSGINEGDAPIPVQLSLTAYPNPANASFSIRYEIPQSADVSLRVYDLNGRRVDVLADGWQTAGEHHIQWDANRHASGIYFVRLESPAFGNRTQKILLVR